jgi:signal transduction histidine kinase
MRVARKKRRAIGGMNRPTGWLAWSLCALSLTFVIVWALFRFLNSPTPTGVDQTLLPLEVWGLLVPVLFTTIGALVASRQPKNTIGWIFCAIGLFLTSSGASGQYAIYAVVSSPDSLPWGGTAAWLEAFLNGPIIFTMFALLLLFFPNGRPPSHRWRVVLWLDLIAALLLFVGSFKPGPMETSSLESLNVANPFGIEKIGALLNVLSSVGLYLTLAVTAVGAVSLIVRFRRSRAEERQQIKWVAFAGAIVCAVFAAGPFLWSLPPSSPGVTLIWPVLIFSAVSTIPVATGIALLKYRLYDIDLIIGRTLVYGALSVIVVGLYMVVVASLGALLRAQGQAQGGLFASLLAAGLVAVLFAPLRDRLQRAVNRLMYGQRDDPYRVLSGLGERLEATLAPNAVLPTIVESVAQALKLPYAAITLKRGADGEPVKAAEYGKKGAGEPLVVPLGYQQETVGELVLSPRSPGESFGNSDLRLLGDLAHQAGVAAHAVHLSTELQRSRERLVTAREEERKRLRRDLHDGVGPQLAALTLKLETARNLLSHDPKTAALMAELSERARATISDVRRSVHALRPPALDELGLVPALREGAAQYNQNGLRISVETPTSLPPLPAAVEVAAYHIAREAMTNVVRHSGASKCSMRIALDEEADVLHLEVEDDGRGLGEDQKAGVGAHSMRERAEELGGRCTIEALPLRGTLVSAQLPCWTARDTHRQEE